MLEQIKKSKKGLNKKNSFSKRGMHLYGIAKGYSLAKRMSHCLIGEKPSKEEEKFIKKSDNNGNSKKNLWLRIIKKKSWKRILNKTSDNTVNN